MMQSVTLRRLLGLGMLVGGGWLGCGSGDTAILASLGPLPARATAVVVSAVLDNKPALTMQPLTPPMDTFAVELPSSQTGHLVLNALAYDSDNCTQGSSTAAVELPSGRIDLAMPLVPQSPRKCGSLAPCAANTLCATPKIQAQTIYGLWVNSLTDIWAVGLAATLVHFDGSTWKVVPPPAGVTENLFGVWGNGPTNVWAVGAFGRILHYDGTTWTITPSPTPLILYGVWGLSNDNSYVWAAGDSATPTSQGIFLRYNGSTWSSIIDPQLGAGRFNSVWADRPNFIYACGVGGLLTRYNGTTWNLIISNTTVNLHSIWGTPGGAAAATIFASGDGGTILRIRYSDLSPGWSAIASTGSTNPLYGIHGDGSKVVYAVGSGGAIVRADAPYDSFVAQNNSALSTLFAVHPVSNGLSWVGGSSGLLGYLDSRP